MSQAGSQFGPLLREWRQRRRVSQLGLSCQADISTRHVSFLETGRSLPSRDMVLHLAETLDVPLRERNQLLAAAGFAPVFQARPLEDPALRIPRQAMEAVVQGHMPYPALAVDRHWTLVTANEAARWLMTGVDPDLLQPPINVLRVALHPRGLAPRTLNLPVWRAHLLARLARQVEVSADPVLASLLRELRGYPAPASRLAAGSADAPAIPFEVQTAAGPLAFVGMTAVFGTPMDITLSELAMECFYPADEQTARMLRTRMLDKAG